MPPMQYSTASDVQVQPRRPHMYIEEHMGTTLPAILHTPLYVFQIQLTPHSTFRTNGKAVACMSPRASARSAHNHAFSSRGQCHSGHAFGTGTVRPCPQTKAGLRPFSKAHWRHHLPPPCPCQGDMAARGFPGQPLPTKPRPAPVPRPRVQRKRLTAVVSRPAPREHCRQGGPPARPLSGCGPPCVSA